MTTTQLEMAIILAVSMHLGQKEWNGDPYILHSFRVMNNVQDTKEKIVAILHDVIEDTSLTLGKLSQEGFDDDIVAAVDAISKRQTESYVNYLVRVAANPIAIQVKLADIDDNLDLSRFDRQLEDEDLIRVNKYRRARKYLLDELRRND